VFTQQVIDIIKLIWPLLAISFAVQIYCLVLIVRQGTRNLSKLVWGLIVLFVSTIGWIAFLLLGRKTD
jgi:hypothetical protein